MSDNKEEVIKLLGGEYDFQRISEEYSENFTVIPPEHKEIVKVLMRMILNGDIFIMDKESGVPMDASGIVGYENDKIIIFCER
jgi:hypothetical protein